jgi:CBS domain-containing protein
MKIQDVMTCSVASCSAHTPLNEVARLMWDHDCGFVPVTDLDSGKLRGVVTDRDICMGAYTKDQPLSRIRAESVMSKDAWTCRPSDDIATANSLMRRHQVRRVPVVDDHGALVGVVSINDLALAAHRNKTMRDEISQTMQEICRHRQVALA